MRYLQLVCTDPEAEPYRPELDNIQSWGEEGHARGTVIDGDRLRPAQEAKTVRVREGRVLVTDGPFAESKEWIAGFDVLECPSLDAAIEVASRHPMARFGRLELRPFADAIPSVPPVSNPWPVSGRAKVFCLFLCSEIGADRYRPESDTTREWQNQAVSEGLLVQGQLLRPVDDATVVRVRHGNLVVTDGPFAVTKDGIVGFALLSCRDEAHALEWAARHPAARFGSVEVRPFWPFE